MTGVELLQAAEALIVDLYEYFDLAHGHDEDYAVAVGDEVDTVLAGIRAVLKEAGDHREVLG